VKVRVLYFATLRQHAGLREESIALGDDATLRDLREVLAGNRPSILASLASAVASVNREFARPEEALHDGDEVAFFPPVSGGDGGDRPTLFRLTQDPLDLNELLAALVGPTIGAACVFTGLVRGQTGGRETNHLEYEAYPAMAQEKMEQVAQEIRLRWPHVDGIAIVQRIGRLEPGSPTVLIACTAAHRDSGVFEAARYGIDRLKEIVPIWKKEFGPTGEAWVEGSYRPGEQDRKG
jgi:molybdopterin synthase catalytic subunit